MRALLAALAVLLTAPAAAQQSMMGFFGAAEAAGGLAIDSTTGCLAPDNASPATCTVASIPNGALVVATFSAWTNASGAPTSANLTFTLRPTLPENNAVSIYTAVAGSSLTSEAISVQAVGQVAAMDIVVLTGANTGALSNSATNSGTGTALSCGVTAVGSASYVIAVFASGPDSAWTPDAGTTTIYNPNSNTGVTARNTTPGGGAITVSGTIAASQGWQAACLEIR